MKFNKDTNKLELDPIGYIVKSYGLYLLFECELIVPVSKEQLDEIQAKLDYKLAVANKGEKRR